MAWEIPGFAYSLPANQDLSVAATYQFTPVRVIAASGTGINTPSAVAPVAASGDPIVGILQNNPGTAEAATLVQNGISKVLAAGIITTGQLVQSLPSGGVMPAQSTKDAIGIALEGGAAGSLITVLLTNLGKR